MEETFPFIAYLKHRVKRRKNSVIDTKPVHSFLHTIDRDMPILEKYSDGQALFVFMTWNYSPRHQYDIEDLRKAYVNFCKYKNQPYEDLGKLHERK